MSKELVRINKYLGESGFCSRREADRLVESGRVTINGEMALMGVKVSDEDVVEVDGESIFRETNDKVYLALNKPVGIECTTNISVNKNIITFLDYPKRIFPIGRLDKASQGLILLTNDGDIVNKILRSQNNHEKEYEVVVDKPITDDFLKGMASGVPILETITKKCVIEQLSEKQFKIILTQGLNRQIRRMCEYFGYEVKKLKRVRVLNINLDTAIGKYRELSKEEIKRLNKIVE